MNQDTSSEKSKANLVVVIKRLVELVHNDLNDLSQLLKKTDIFSFNHEQSRIEQKRERCLTLLKVLQNALAAEIKREYETNSNPNEDVELIHERFQRADKIMSLLRKLHFIESSELAEYLKTALQTDIESEISSSGSFEVGMQKEPKSIKKLRKVYQTGLNKK